MYLVNGITSHQVRISTQMLHRQPDFFPPHPVDAHFCNVPEVNEVIRVWGRPNPCYENLQISVWVGFYLIEPSLQNYSGHSTYPILH